MLKLKIKKIALTPIFALVLFLGFLPVFGFTSIASDGIDPVTIYDTEGLFGILDRVVDLVFRSFFVVAIGFIIWAAFNFLTSGGDEKKVGAAKQKLIYAIIAIIVALLAFSFPHIIRNFIG